MFDRKLLQARLLAALASTLVAGPVFALDLGFSALLTLEASDNVEGVDAPEEEDGVTAGALLGVYGEQRSTVVDAAFSAEIDTRNIVSEDDSSFDTVSRFLGAAEISLTPRSWRWYIGDILGGVRVDDAVQIRDEDITNRRNVFATGPSFEYDVQGVSRTRARLLFVNQTEDDEQLENVYNASFSYEKETTPGSYFGFRAGDIYTNVSESLDNNVSGEDFNRASLSVFWNRLRGFLELYGEMGVTRYDTDEDSLNGLNAELSATRRLGPQTSISARLDRDLNDQSLTAIESLIDSGGQGTGVRPEVSGFFSDTRLTLEYTFQSSRTSLDLGVGVAQIDYQLQASDLAEGLDIDNEDRVNSFAYGSASQRLNSDLRGEVSVSYQRQSYDNIQDESDSVLATAKLIYRLSRSFELEGRYDLDTATGIRTRNNVLDDIDITENRISIGLRWAPPSRADRELTVELKSLLQ